MNADEEAWHPVCKQMALEMMLAEIKTDLADMGINHDVFTSEQKIVDDGAVEKAYKALEDQGLIYTGVLEAPKGKTPDEWEERPQTLFRATQFGDDTDRPLKKSAAFTRWGPPAWVATRRRRYSTATTRCGTHRTCSSPMAPA
jgi:arginyl-tRNA synthetase